MKKVLIAVVSLCVIGAVVYFVMNKNCQSDCCQHTGVVDTCVVADSCCAKVDSCCHKAACTTPCEKADSCCAKAKCPKVEKCCKAAE